ncbi:MAG: YggT family protein [Anaerolineae bacterium]|nr:YggT family protein [Anaerolineae bacterium]
MTGFLLTFINLLFEALSLAILARVLLSWFQVDPYNQFVQLLFQVTEPILGPFRRFVPPLGMIDISPIVALLVLQVAQRVIIGTLIGLL